MSLSQHSSAELRLSSSNERGRRLEQLELMLEDAEETCAVAEIAAEVAIAAVEPARSQARDRRPPMRGPLPEHLPRERIVVAGPTVCSCCG